MAKKATVPANVVKIVKANPKAAKNFNKYMHKVEPKIAAAQKKFAAELNKQVKAAQKEFIKAEKINVPKPVLAAMQKESAKFCRMMATGANKAIKMQFRRMSMGMIAATKIKNKKK